MLWAMRLGCFLLAAQHPGMSHADALETALEAAVAAEQAGLDSAWIAEHHFISYGVCPSAATFAANLLGRTRRLVVGTAVAVLSNQHPIALAEQTALLDHLSGGRFHLGVGRGGPYVDLEVFDTGVERYQHGFAEALDLLLRWLEQDRVRGDGQRFSFREVTVVPRPVTRPRPPVTVACTSGATIELAASRGLPMLLGMHVGDEAKAAAVARYAEVAERHGHDPGRVEHMAAALALVADSRAEAGAALRAALPRWLERGLGDYTYLVAPRSRRDPRDYAEHLLAIHPVGTAEDCAERLAASAERTGIRHFLLMVEGCGERHRVLDTIARVGAEVRPRLLGHGLER